MMTKPRSHMGHRPTLMGAPAVGPPINSSADEGVAPRVAGSMVPS
jgi:hypothetical protein